MIGGLVVILSCLASFGQAVPNNKTIDKVAEYIDLLQSTGKYHMIYNLFGVGNGVSKDTLRKRQTALLKECYLQKKSGGSPLGKEINYNLARTLISTGYQILTDPELKEAYDWVLNDAPPEFMFQYRRRKEKSLALFSFMPSALLVALVSLGVWLILDIVYTFASRSGSHRATKKEKQKEKRGKQKGGVRLPTWRDTMTARTFGWGFSFLAQTLTYK
ncbi:hypothetical protein NEHOM01_0742 [Nematocida homosporus]|uniref:uncharacterized protein n=1 Tax=Nematocida homosporus TaxID=1912981 RepID=UPI0022207435|nr:uncharacterized protein NEHOM01_0742 [Nematocida homosporus]KAI5185284.1 hypothetical protein NEHOM01_0742 [Nematocida homosporus]